MDAGGLEPFFMAVYGGGVCLIIDKKTADMMIPTNLAHSAVKLVW